MTKKKYSYIKYEERFYHWIEINSLKIGSVFCIKLFFNRFAKYFGLKFYDNSYVSIRFKFLISSVLFWDSFVQIFH